MSQTIPFLIPKAVVTAVFTSDKNGNQYMRFSSPAGEVSLSCPSMLRDFNAYLEADRQDVSRTVRKRWEPPGERGRKASKKKPQPSWTN